MQTAKLTVVTFDAQDVIATSNGIKGYYGTGETLEYTDGVNFNIGGKFYAASFNGYSDDSKNYLATFVSYFDGDPGIANITFEPFEGDTTGYVEITEDDHTAMEGVFTWLIEHGKSNQ